MTILCGKLLIPSRCNAHLNCAHMEVLASSTLDLFLAYDITIVHDTDSKIDWVRTWQIEARSKPTAAPRVVTTVHLISGSPNVDYGSATSRAPLSIGLH